VAFPTPPNGSQTHCRRCICILTNSTTIAILQVPLGGNAHFCILYFFQNRSEKTGIFLFYYNYRCIQNVNELNYRLIIFRARSPTETRYQYTCTQTIMYYVRGFRRSVVGETVLRRVQHERVDERTLRHGDRRVWKNRVLEMRSEVSFRVARIFVTCVLRNNTCCCGEHGARRKCDPSVKNSHGVFFVFRLQERVLWIVAVSEG